MNPRRIRVLAVDDDALFLRQMSRLLGSDYLVECAANEAEALAALRAGGIDVTLLDLDLGRGMDGLEVLEKLHELDPDLPVVMVTQDASSQSAVAALQRGATGYINKVSDLEVLKRQLWDALESQRVLGRYRFLRREIEMSKGEMVGESLALQHLRAEIKAAAAGSSPVLVLGETGTGKELVARLLHRCGCPDQPFVPVNCAAIPAELIESELFGCVPGAFSGAVMRRGAFEVATHGVLFLDEITEVSPAFQSKLNRVIEYNEFTPVGADPVRAKKQFAGRVVAATNRNLADAMAQGSLRQDLFHRFTHVLTVPPLRERRDDIPALVDHFLDRASRQRGLPRPSLHSEHMQRLCAYAWPGNVRELKNVVENFTISGALPALGTPGPKPGEAPGADFADLTAMPYADAKRIAVRRFQQAYVHPTLAACQGDHRLAAERMGLSLPGLKKVLAELEGRTDSSEE